MSYEGAIRRAGQSAAVWLKRFEDESHHAKELLAELLHDPGPEPMERIRQAPPALSLKLLRLLQDRCRSSWVKEPAEAIELAHLEVAVAERLDESRCGSGVTADSRALAWADLGNSYRILADFGAAEQALKRAAEHQGLCGDPLTESEILGFLASLRRGQARFTESLSLLDRVFGIAREGDDRYREGRALIAKGTAIGDQAMGGRGSFRQAIRVLRKGLSRIDPSADPELFLAARHNILFFFAEAGRPREAEEILRQERQLYDDLGRDFYVARLRWLEGLIDEGQGRLENAEASFRCSRDMLSQQKLILDSAFANLQLSLVLEKQNRRAEARQLLDEAIPVFESVGDEWVVSAARLLSLRLRS